MDALLTPTMMTPAPLVASIDQNTTPAVFTRWVNFYDLVRCGGAERVYRERAADVVADRLPGV